LIDQNNKLCEALTFYKQIDEEIQRLKDKELSVISGKLSSVTSRKNKINLILDDFIPWFLAEKNDDDL
jgi:hypothetical protein